MAVFTNDPKFATRALADYRSWAKSGNKKAIKKINDLIADIQENGLLYGIGKPEKLRYRDNEYSREISKGDRLVYTQVGEDLVILSCRGHYEDK